MGLRLPELLIILIVVVLIFGANKIPQLGDALGRGIRNFKKASDDDSIDVTPKKEEPEKLSQGAPTSQASSTASATAEKKKA